MQKAVARANGWVLLDEGVPFALQGERIYRIRGGEGVKRWAELEKILAWLAAGKAERSQPLLVIGGGAVLDLGALAASLYRRGMPLTLVPTTLLGMVDATLGGKTAVDAELGGSLLKNFAGTFYPASQVWIAPAFLATLPQRERASGAGEVYKSLWLKGGKVNTKPLEEFVRTGKGNLEPLIRTCLELKSKFVERDPLDDKRIREALNFGHTVGHALESLSEHSHGECVLWGMAVESTLLKKCTVPWAEALRAREIPTQFIEKQPEDWLKALSADKKNKAGKIEMSLLEKPGKIVKKKFTAAQIAQAIKAFPAVFQRAVENLRS